MGPRTAEGGGPRLHIILVLFTPSGRFNFCLFVPEGLCKCESTSWRILRLQAASEKPFIRRCQLSTLWGKQDSCPASAQEKNTSVWGTCTIALGSGCVSSSVMATKLNPLNSWWALALGGTPGESKTDTETAVNPQRSVKWLYWECSSAQQSMRRRRRRWGRVTVCTSGCFSCELWIKIESVVRSSCSRFERRVDLSAVQFLRKTSDGARHSHDKNTRRSVIFNFISTLVSLTFQSMVLKNWCLLISSTPSGPAPAKQNHTTWCSTRHTSRGQSDAKVWEIAASLFIPHSLHKHTLWFLKSPDFLCISQGLFSAAD